MTDVSGTRSRVTWTGCSARGGEAARYGANFTKTLTLTILVSKFELSIKLFAHFPILMM